MTNRKREKEDRENMERWKKLGVEKKRSDSIYFKSKQSGASTSASTSRKRVDQELAVNVRQSMRRKLDDGCHICHNAVEHCQCLTFIPPAADASSNSRGALTQSEIIFMGTGTSEGIPRISCLTEHKKSCLVCFKAIEPGNKNRRLNTGLLIRHAKADRTHNIMIDVGKFFYHSAVKWFPAYGIRALDAIIITHAHADAIGGLDDLRGLTNNVQRYIPVYTTSRDFEVIKKTHFYLIDQSIMTSRAAVPKLKFNIIEEGPFVVHGLQFTPLPVWHGLEYRSLGFRFGNICYISDVSDIPQNTYPLLEKCDLLIMDALRPYGSSSTHFILPRALEEVRKIRPKRTLFTGMMHLMDHEKVNEELMKLKETEGIDVQLSYDGLRLPVLL